MKRWIGAAALAVATLAGAGGATAQDGRVWQYSPSQPGVMFHNQPGLTYWRSPEEVPFFDNICHMTASGSVNVNMMLQMVTPLPDSTEQPLTILAPDGRSFTFDATISHAFGPAEPGIASISIPITHPAAIGLTHWPMLSARLPGSEHFDLALTAEGHEAATQFFADCATLPTAPPAGSVVGPPDPAWSYQPASGDSGAVLQLWYPDQLWPYLQATCTAPGQAAIRLAADDDPAVPGQATTIRVYLSDGEQLIIPGATLQRSHLPGHGEVAVTLPLTHPLFTWLEQHVFVAYVVGGQGVQHELEAARAGTTVSDFLADCDGLAPAPAAPMPPHVPVSTATPSPSSGGEGCSDLGRVRSGIGSTPFQATFVNRQQAPRVLFWIDNAGQAQQMAFLEPGYQTVIETDQAHVWLITDASGQCRGMIRPVPGRPIIELAE